MFSEDTIGRVRDSVDIVDFISGYVSLRKTGKNHQGLCPFHGEKTPSFSVNPDKQIFHCFGCGVGGDIFKFAELQEGLSFPEAVRKFAAKSGISLPEFTKNSSGNKRTEDEKKRLYTIVADAAAYYQMELRGPAGSAARNYFEKRGVTETVIHEFGLGFARPEWDGLLKSLKQKNYSPVEMERAGLAVKRSEGDGHYDRFRGRIMFPIRDISGNVIAFGGRVMDDSLPKYLNSSETPLYSKSNVLFGLDTAKDHARKQGYFIIVEGYLDAIACHQHGVRNTVATLGTALTEGHLRLMRRFTDKIVLIFDPDPAGVKASLRSFDLFVSSGMKVNVVSLPGGDDPDTFLQKRGKEAFDGILKSSVKLMDFVLSQVLTIGSAAPIDQRMDVAKEVAAFIEKIPDGNVQRVYIKQLIDALDIDWAIFREERLREGKASTIQNKVHKEMTPTPRRKPPAEELLIHIMLNDDKIARTLKDRIDPQDFTDPLLRSVAARIFELLAKHETLEIDVLLREGNDELKKVISHYSVLEMVYDDPEKSSQDCVDLIKQKDPEKKMKLLVKALQEAEARDDQSTIERLIFEQQELSRRPGRKIPGKSGTNQG